MFRIDKRNIKREVERLGSRKKIVKGLSVSHVADSYKQSVWNLMDKLSEVDAYSMAQWLVHVERWIDDHGKEVKTKYLRGDIVFIELGAMNFGYEASYEHPAIVIANSYNMVLVAPCSSKSFGRGYRDVIDITTAEATGLTDNTGIGVGGIRWISKNRILNKAGVVKNVAILDKIDDSLLKKLDYYQVILAHHDNEIFDLEREKRKTEEELAVFKEILGSVEDLISRQSPDLLESYRAIASGKV